MTTEIKCTRFAPGAAVPEWLLAAEPMGPDSVAGLFIFQIECDVIELEGRFVLAPTQTTGDMLPTLYYGGRGARLYAPAKPVCSAVALQTFWGLDVNAWSEVPQVAQAPLPVETAAEFQRRQGQEAARAAQMVAQEEAYRRATLDAARRAYAVPGIPADQLGEWPPAPGQFAPLATQPEVKPRGFWRRLWDAIANA